MKKELIVLSAALALSVVFCAPMFGAESEMSQEHIMEAEGDSGEGESHGESAEGESEGGRAHGGGAMAGNDEECQKLIDETCGKFTQFTYVDEETGVELEYSLFIPDDYNEEIKYPMIMFIPDSTGSGKSAAQVVEQYYGANVWASEEDQQNHPSFVLVPAFDGVVVDDNWNTSEEIDTCVKLINDLISEYSIDTDRLYTTGQSMGCMTSLYLNSVYPELFAASMFVSGQWDINVLFPLENEEFFYITAAGDTKASGGQDEVMAMFDADGVAYTYGEWSAADSTESQNAAVQMQISEGTKANMVRFERGSTLSDGQSGSEHMTSFNFAYKLSSVRDWLFEQHK